MLLLPSTPLPLLMQSWMTPKQVMILEKAFEANPCPTEYHPSPRSLVDGNPSTVAAWIRELQDRHPVLRKLDRLADWFVERRKKAIAADAGAAGPGAAAVAAVGKTKVRGTNLISLLGLILDCSKHGAQERSSCAACTACTPCSLSS